MKRAVLLCITSAFVAGFTQFAPAAGEPVGLVLTADGGLSVVRDGKRLSLHLADLLHAGDQVQSADGARILFCPSSAQLSLGPDTGLTLTSGGYDLTKGSEPTTQAVRRCTLPQIALGSESMERIGGVRVRKAALPELTLHLGGPVSATRPRFDWEAYPEADRYRVSLHDLTGSSLWQESTQETHLQTPVDLAPGVYEWRAEAMKSEQPIAEAATRFEVKPSADWSPPSPDSDPAAVLVEAVELENAGFYAEAAQLYRRLRGPASDERLTKHLAWLYQQAGLSKAADDELGKLPE